MSSSRTILGKSCFKSEIDRCNALISEETLLTFSVKVNNLSKEGKLKSSLP